MRRLLPHADDPIDVAQLLSELALGDRAPAQRPYTVANLVSSIDGRATFDGRSSALGDAGDKAIFRALRGCCEALLVGTGTLRAERYGPIVTRPQTVALRARLGLAPQPLTATITRTGSLPADVPLLQDPGAHVVVYSGGPVDADAVRARLDVVELGPERLTVAAALADLRQRHGVGLLLCEGGPTLVGQLIGAGALDELFVTLAARLAGGDGGAIVRGLVLPEPLELRLGWLLEQDGSLFARYGLPTRPTS